MSHSEALDSPTLARPKEHQFLSEEDAPRISLLRKCPQHTMNIDDVRSLRLTSLNQPLQKSVRKLLALKDTYGPIALIDGIRRAISLNAHGATYVENLLYQEATPRRAHPPVTLKRDELNRIRLDEPSLADYDALVVKGRANP